MNLSRLFKLGPLPSKNYVDYNLSAIICEDAANVFPVDKYLRETKISAELIGSRDIIKSLFPNIENRKNVKITESISQKDSILKLLETAKTQSDKHTVLSIPTSHLSILAAALPEEYSFTSVSIFTLPESERAVLLTDAFLDYQPTPATLAKLAENAHRIFKLFSDKKPKTAFLSANEKASEKVASTLSAQQAAELSRENMLAEGPLSFDLSLSPASADIKQYKGEIRGDADILVAPRRETASALYFSWKNFANLHPINITFINNTPSFYCDPSDSDISKLLSAEFAITSKVKRPLNKNDTNTQEA